jgi:hypothetical protein
MEDNPANEPAGRVPDEATPPALTISPQPPSTSFAQASETAVATTPTPPLQATFDIGSTRQLAVFQFENNNISRPSNSFPATLLQLPAPASTQVFRTLSPAPDYNLPPPGDFSTRPTSFEIDPAAVHAAPPAPNILGPEAGNVLSTANPVASQSEPPAAPPSVPSERAPRQFAKLPRGRGRKGFFLQNTNTPTHSEQGTLPVQQDVVSGPVDAVGAPRAAQAEQTQVVQDLLKALEELPADSSTPIPVAPEVPLAPRYESESAVQANNAEAERSRNLVYDNDLSGSFILRGICDVHGGDRCTRCPRLQEQLEQAKKSMQTLEASEKKSQEEIEFLREQIKDIQAQRNFNAGVA